MDERCVQTIVSIHGLNVADAEQYFFRDCLITLPNIPVPRFEGEAAIQSVNT